MSPEDDDFVTHRELQGYMDSMIAHTYQIEGDLKRTMMAVATHAEVVPLIEPICREQENLRSEIINMESRIDARFSLLAGTLLQEQERQGGRVLRVEYMAAFISAATLLTLVCVQYMLWTR